MKSKMICKYLKHEDTKLIDILEPVGRYDNNLVSILKFNHADMGCERGMGVHVSMAFVCLCIWVCLCMACMC